MQHSDTIHYIRKYYFITRPHSTPLSLLSSPHSETGVLIIRQSTRSFEGAGSECDRHVSCEEGTAKKRRSRNMEETPNCCYEVPDNISVKAEKDT